MVCAWADPTSPVAAINVQAATEMTLRRGACLETVKGLRREASGCVLVFTMRFPMRGGWHPHRQHCSSMNTDSLRHASRRGVPVVGKPLRCAALWLAHSGSPAVMGPKPFRPLTLRRALSCVLPFSDKFLVHCGVDPFDAVRERTKTSFQNIFGPCQRKLREIQSAEVRPCKQLFRPACGCLGRPEEFANQWHPAQLLSRAE